MSDFNRLWAGQSISLLGSALTAFALPTLAILLFHATPLEIGVLWALQTLPFPVLGLLVGILADRLSRRRIMIAGDIARSAALVSIPIAAYAGVLRMPQIYGVALITGIASAFFGISYQSYLPVVVPAERLTDANTKLEFSNSGAAMAGNALAGVLVQFLGAAVAIGADAFSYLVSVLSLLTIRAKEQPHCGPRLSFGQALIEVRQGLNLVFGSPDLRWILGATATVNFGGGLINAVFLIYAYRILHLKPGLLGLVDGLAEIGFAGALASSHIRRLFGLRSTLVGALLLGAAGTATMLSAMLAVPYAVLFISSAIVAVSIPVYNVTQVSYRQALVDVRMQGRMNATIRTFVWGTVPLGAVVGGYLGTVVGAPRTIAIGALCWAVASAWLIPLRERTSQISAPAVTSPKISSNA